MRHQQYDATQIQQHAEQLRRSLRPLERASIDAAASTQAARAFNAPRWREMAAVSHDLHDVDDHHRISALEPHLPDVERFAALLTDFRRQAVAATAALNEYTVSLAKTMRETAYAASALDESQASRLASAQASLTPPLSSAISPSTAQYVVKPGESWWMVAEQQLRQGGQKPTPAEVQAYVKRLQESNGGPAAPAPSPGQTVVLP